MDDYQKPGRGFCAQSTLFNQVTVTSFITTSPHVTNVMRVPLAAACPGRGAQVRTRLGGIVTLMHSGVPWGILTHSRGVITSARHARRGPASPRSRRSGTRAPGHESGHWPPSGHSAKVTLSAHSHPQVTPSIHTHYHEYQSHSHIVRSEVSFRSHPQVTPSGHSAKVVLCPRAGLRGCECKWTVG